MRSEHRDSGFLPTYIIYISIFNVALQNKSQTPEGHSDSNYVLIYFIYLVKYILQNATSIMENI